MDDRSVEYATVDVRMPAALFTDLDADAATRGYSSVDAAVSDAIERQTNRA